MKRLVPTSLVNKGTVTVSEMFMQVGNAGDGPPKSFEQQSVEEHLWRAKRFLGNYNPKGDPRLAVACLSAAIRSAVAIQQQMDAYLKLGRLTFQKLTGGKRLSYQGLLKHIRNHEEHYFTIPSVNGEYFVGETEITGKAMLQLIDAKPRRWRKNGRVDTNKPILLVVQDGQVVAFDESKSKAVNLAYAVHQYIQSLEVWLSNVFKAPVVDPPRTQ